MTKKSKEKPEAKRGRSLIPDVMCEDLMKPHEVVRDPVHGDIYITALERTLIDTQAFQRLRYLKQLGSTSMVYPGAVHTRFVHSLGTLHAADMMVEVINRNAAVYPEDRLLKIPLYPHFLIRLCALLHDVAHIPFGHALEDEGNLTRGKSEWKDDERAVLWLGDDSELACSVVKFLREAGMAEDDALVVMDDIRAHVLHGTHDIMNLGYPYIADIIGNTICADLLDYIERDMYFCGLRDRTGDRVLKYLCVLPLKRSIKSDNVFEHVGKPEDEKDVRGRVVLLAYRQEKEHAPKGSYQTVEKVDVLSEAIDLLRRRFCLAEKVYFHRTKTSGAAMLISAAAEAVTDFDEIYRLTDDSFLQLLQQHDSPRTKNLAEQYLKRNPYKAPYYVAYREPAEDVHSEELWGENRVYEKYRQPDERTKLEAQLEQVFGLPAGTVSVYCPKKDMNMKEFRVLVQQRPMGEVKMLKDTLDVLRRNEMNAVNARFARLWKLQVFVDPLLIKPGTQNEWDFADMCESLVGLENDNNRVKDRSGRAHERYARAAIKGYCDRLGISEAEITLEEFDKLAAGVSAERGVVSGATQVDLLIDELREIRREKDRERDGGVRDGGDDLPLVTEHPDKES